MKKILPVWLLLSFSMASHGQPDLSGTYGYSLPGTTIPKDKSAIPGGQLVLIKMEGNKYRFWLDVLTGPPGYNRGETDGTLHFVNDTASFDNTFEDAEHPCILKFKLTGTTLHINSQSSSFNCGFGNGVHADGDYKKLKTQPALNDEWLKKQYPFTPAVVITTPQAELYQDENCQHPFTPKKQFSKGAILLSIAETEKSVYTELITTEGKFIYGWLKKTSLEATDAR